MRGSYDTLLRTTPRKTVKEQFSWPVTNDKVLDTTLLSTPEEINNVIKSLKRFKVPGPMACFHPYEKMMEKC